MTKGKNEKTQNKYYSFGLDFGTTNMSVGTFKENRVQIVPNSDGSRTTPSVVLFNEDGSTIVGEVAKNGMANNPKNTVGSIKRLILNKADAPLPPYLEQSPCLKGRQIEMRNSRREIWIDSRKKFMTIPEICSILILEKKRDVASFHGVSADKVKNVVITVPAHFNDYQRNQIIEACKIAKLNPLRVVNEPTAAALSYGFADSKSKKNILVFDLGGGTFDVSVLVAEDGVLEVKSTNGDLGFGGDDVNRLIMDATLKEFRLQHPDAILCEDYSSRLFAEAENVKKRLSTMSTVDAEIMFFASDGGKPLHLKQTKKLSWLEQSLEEQFGLKTKEIIDKSISESGFNKEDINDVVMVGGSTRLNWVYNLLIAQFDEKKIKKVNPDEIVSEGAAKLAQQLHPNPGSNAFDEDKVLLLDVIPLSLGIETMGGMMTKIVPKNTTIPSKKTQVFSTAADNQTSVTISIYQGDRSMAKDNVKLGTFNLEGIDPAPRGTPQIEVTFSVDANSILSVSAQDKGTGKTNKVTIENPTKMSDEEIEKLQKEAEKYQEIDKQKKELAESKNNAESTIFLAKNTLKEREDLKGSGIEKDVNQEIDALNILISKDDKEAIDAGAKSLTEKISKFPKKPEKPKEEQSKTEEPKAK